MSEVEIDDALLEEVIGELSEPEPPLSLHRLSELLTDKIYEADTAFRYKHGRDAERRLMLTEAENLVVIRNDGLHRRESFIGGEEFALQAAYSSKNQKTLYWVLRPLFACGFQVLHVDEGDAERLLNGMTRWLNGELAELMERRHELHRSQQLQMERSAVASRSEYQNEYGGLW